MIKDWLFAYKLPDVGYGLKFSKSVTKKLESLDDIVGLDLKIIADKEVFAMPTTNEENDINLIIQSGLKKGKIKTLLNSKILHDTLATAGFYPRHELLEEVYGYRFTMTWNKELSIFVIKG